MQYVNMTRAMMTEADWKMTGRRPSIEEYLEVGQPSFGLGPIVLSSLYFLGPELTEEAVRSQEYIELFRHMSICGRLLNDIRSYKREQKQGKINSVLLLADRNGGSIEAAKTEARRLMQASRIKLLRLAVKKDGAVPRACRAGFWNLGKILYHFYIELDGYESPKEMLRAGNLVVHEPLRLPAAGGEAAASTKSGHASLS